MRADDVGAGDVEDLVAALEPLEVVQGRGRAACSIVPIAPSATTGRRRRVVRKLELHGSRTWSKRVPGRRQRLAFVIHRRAGRPQMTRRPAPRHGVGRRLGRVTEFEDWPRADRPRAGRRLRGLERRRRRRHRSGGAPRADLGRHAARRARPGGLLRLPGQPARRCRWSTACPGGSTGRPPGSRCAGRRAPPATWCWCAASSPTCAGAAFTEELLDVDPRAGRGDRRALGALLADTPHTRPDPGQRHVVRRGARPSGGAWSAAGTRGRPASSASCRTRACGPASRRSRSGRRSRTTCPSRPTRRRRWRCCTGSRRCSTSRCRWPTCPRRPTSGRSSSTRWPPRTTRSPSTCARSRSARATSTMPQASGEAIAREFERYLRRRQPPRSGGSGG